VFFYDEADLQQQDRKRPHKKTGNEKNRAPKILLVPPNKVQRHAGGNNCADRLPSPSRTNSVQGNRGAIFQGVPLLLTYVGPRANGPVEASEKNQFPATDEKTKPTAQRKAGLFGLHSTKGRALPDKEKNKGQNSNRMARDRATASESVKRRAAKNSLDRRWQNSKTTDEKKRAPCVASHRASVIVERHRDGQETSAATQ